LPYNGDLAENIFGHALVLTFFSQNIPQAQTFALSDLIPQTLSMFLFDIG
jgi:hypothetical protein